MLPSKFLDKTVAIKIQLFLVIGLTLNIVPASAQSGASGQLRMTPQEIIVTKRSGQNAPGSSNLSAVQVVVIHGDPSKPGLYTILLKVAPNTKIPAHLHPDDRVGTVVSGTWYFGYGDKFDESKLKQLPVGSIYSEVEDQNHFAMTKNEPVIAEITGYGPSGVTYVNPQDDPQHKK
ncbi:MAG: cupin domain-containing protein [Ginsengibacter sp.]